MSAAAAAATVAAISAARKAHVLKCTADNFVWPLWPLWVHGYEPPAIIAASLLLGLIGGGLAAYVVMRVFTK